MLQFSGRIDTRPSAFNDHPDYNEHLIILLAAALNRGHDVEGGHREDARGRFIWCAGFARFFFRVERGAAS
jgi:hypothetical protein